MFIKEHMNIVGQEQQVQHVKTLSCIRLKSRFLKWRDTPVGRVKDRIAIILLAAAILSLFAFSWSETWKWAAESWSYIW